ncbi:MAG: hypothetical protein D6798_17550, partial [Deltaproteobacteria bacterium]
MRSWLKPLSQFAGAICLLTALGGCPKQDDTDMPARTGRGESSNPVTAMETAPPTDVEGVIVELRDGSAPGDAT